MLEMKVKLSLGSYFIVLKGFAWWCPLEATEGHGMATDTIIRNLYIFSNILPKSANNGHLNYITKLQNNQITLSPVIRGRTYAGTNLSLLFSIFTSYWWIKEINKDTLKSQAMNISTHLKFWNSGGKCRLIFISLRWAWSI